MSQWGMNRLQRGIYQGDSKYQPSKKDNTVNHSQYL